MLVWLLFGVMAAVIIFFVTAPTEIKLGDVFIGLFIAICGPAGFVISIILLFVEKEWWKITIWKKKKQ